MSSVRSSPRPASGRESAACRIAPISCRRRRGRCRLRTAPSTSSSPRMRCCTCPTRTRSLREIFRVLKPGGVFAASNWMIGHDGEPSPDMKAYVEGRGAVVQHGLARPLPAGDGAARALPTSRSPTAIPGTARRRAPSCRGCEDRSTRPSPPAVGKDYVDKNIRTWEAMQKVLDSGEHRPTHLRGWKPDRKQVAGYVEIGCGNEDGDARPGGSGTRQEGRTPRRKAARPPRKRGGSS